MRPENLERIQQVAVKYALSAENIGSTVPNNLEIGVDGITAVNAPVLELKQAWAGALEKALHTETEEQLAISS